jgi:hypothetical protein
MALERGGGSSGTGTPVNVPDAEADGLLYGRKNNAWVQTNATDTTFTPTGTLSSTTVQAAIAELESDVVAGSGLADHIADTADAHDASAISVTPTGTLAADDVQEALVEILGDVETHVADAAGAHAASAISFTPVGTIAATDVQAAIAEVASEAASTTVATDAIWATKGDLVVATGNDAAVVVPVGTDGYVLTADSGETAGVSWQEPGTTSAPTVQTFTSGSGTYTKPAGCTRIHVRMVGGGGGGSGGGTTWNAGGNGGTSTFGTSLLTCAGGTGATGVSNSAPGAGGAATIASPAIGVAVNGAGGSSGLLTTAGNTTSYARGGSGAPAPYFSGINPGNNQAGPASTTVANTGAGGGGGGTNAVASASGGSGGGSGGFVDAIIAAPNSTYAYAVGAAGTAGGAGTNGYAGTAGAAGQIIVTEYYGNFDSVLQLNEPASTKQEFTSGSGTYTTPAGVNRIRVRMVGGGSGGSGGGSAPGTSTAGGNSTFGSSLLTATGGGAAAPPGNYPPSGATGTVSSPAVGFAIAGGGGGYFTALGGGNGGSSAMGGGGVSAGAAAGGAAAGSGGGGGGGGASSGNGGNGGAAGGTVDAWIWNPSSTYAYSVGTSGGGGAAGGSGFAGGAGAAGRIIVEEFYGPSHTVADTVPVGGYARNRLHNGDFSVAQRGTSYASAGTLFVNADTNTILDRWRILSDGNDIVDITQATDVPTAPGARYSIGLDVETVNKKFGILQHIERNNCQDLIGRAVTLQFKARVTSTTKLDNVKAAVLYWTGTADTLTADPISAWGVEGTDPTLVASYAYASTPVNLGVTTSFQRYTVAANVPSNATNVSVFLWSDVTDTTLGDFLYITDVQLEAGSVATTFEREDYQVQLEKCQRYCPAFRGTAINQPIAEGACTSTTGTRHLFMFPVQARVPPTSVVLSAATDFSATISTGGFAALTNLTFNTAGTKCCGLIGTAASGLVAGDASQLFDDTGNGVIIFQGCDL